MKMNEKTTDTHTESFFDLNLIELALADFQLFHDRRYKEKKTTFAQSP